MGSAVPMKRPAAATSELGEDASPSTRGCHSPGGGFAACCLVDTRVTAQCDDAGPGLSAPCSSDGGPLMSRLGLPAQLEGDLDATLKAIDREEDARCIRIGGIRLEDDLNRYTIFKRVPIARKAELVAKAADASNLLNRAMGSMCGMAIGDGLGHPFEFLPTQDWQEDFKGAPHFDLRRVEFIAASNAFNLKPGQWTDDAAMGLCMADSLILRETFDGSDMRIRFWCWWNRGYNNAFRLDDHRRSKSSVGLGGNIAKSLYAMRGGTVPSPKYEAETEDAGNGSLMRFTPVALFLHAADWKTAYDTARASSYTTHPGIIAAEACSLLAHLIIAALKLPEGEPRDRQGVRDFLEKATRDYLVESGLDQKSGWGYDQMKWLVKGEPTGAKERCWRWREEHLGIRETLTARGARYNGYPVSAGYFGSYSLDGLAMALWAVYHTSSFEEAVTRSVNLLGDADSHGSITGQLAGALYGYKAIKTRAPFFLDWLNTWDEHEFAARAALLCYQGDRWAMRHAGV